MQSGRHTTIGEGGGTCAHNFNPVRRTSSGGCVCRWKGGTVGRVRTRRILLRLFLEAISRVARVSGISGI